MLAYWNCVAILLWTMINKNKLNNKLFYFQVKEVLLQVIPRKAMLLVRKDIFVVEAVLQVVRQHVVWVVVLLPKYYPQCQP